MATTTPRQFQAVVSPSGVIGIAAASETDAAFGQAASVPSALLDQFQRSMFAGLSYLASTKCDVPLPPSIQFWRQVSERYFTALRRQSGSGSAAWTTPQRPSDEAITEQLDAAPPMLSLEYVSKEMLKSLWSGLDDYTREQVGQTGGGLASYLRSLRPSWNLVGRVTFHLAENKKNPERPFAFLATYTEGQSQSGSITSRFPKR